MCNFEATRLLAIVELTSSRMIAEIFMKFGRDPTTLMTFIMNPGN